MFEKLFNIAEYSNLNKEDKSRYDTSLKRKWDNAAVMDTARMDGLAQGKLEGKLEGKTEGILEGKAEEVRNLIVKLRLTDERAAEVSGAAIEFVKEIREGLKSKK